MWMSTIQSVEGFHRTKIQNVEFILCLLGWNMDFLLPLSLLVLGTLSDWNLGPPAIELHHWLSWVPTLQTDCGTYQPPLSCIYSVFLEKTNSCFKIFVI